MRGPRGERDTERSRVSAGERGAVHTRTLKNLCGAIGHLCGGRITATFGRKTQRPRSTPSLAHVETVTNDLFFAIGRAGQCWG